MSDIREILTNIINTPQLPQGSIQTADIQGRLMSSTELGATITAIIAWHKAELERVIGEREDETDTRTNRKIERNISRNILRWEQRKRAGL